MGNVSIYHVISFQFCYTILYKPKESRSVKLRTQTASIWGSRISTTKTSAWSSFRYLARCRDFCSYSIQSPQEGKHLDLQYLEGSLRIPATLIWTRQGLCDCQQGTILFFCTVLQVSACATLINTCNLKKSQTTPPTLPSCIPLAPVFSFPSPPVLLLQTLPVPVSFLPISCWTLYYNCLLLLFTR